MLRTDPRSGRAGPKTRQPWVSKMRQPTMALTGMQLLYLLLLQSLVPAIVSGGEFAGARRNSPTGSEFEPCPTLFLSLSAAINFGVQTGVFSNEQHPFMWKFPGAPAYPRRRE
jgi:hypothetical protein